MKNSFCAVFIIFLLCACKTHSESPSIPSKVEAAESIKSFEWLLGDWKRLEEEDGLVTYEKWRKASDTKFTGIGYTMKGMDTLKQEQIELNKIDQSWELMVKIPEEELAIIFEVMDQGDKEFTCHNGQNVFPKTIKYWKENNLLKAEVSNEEFAINFKFEKIPEN